MGLNFVAAFLTGILLVEDPIIYLDFMVEFIASLMSMFFKARLLYGAAD